MDVVAVAVKTVFTRLTVYVLFFVFVTICVQFFFFFAKTPLCLDI